jgi:death-on-curing protein
MNTQHPHAQTTERPQAEPPQDDPIWVPAIAVNAAHHDQLVEHGGAQGLRDLGAPEAALARPRQRKHDEPDSDLATLAAAYAFGLATADPFTDGNKRLAFVTAEIFPGLNGYTLSWPDMDVVTTMLALAADELNEADLAAWFRAGLTALPPDQSGHRHCSIRSVAMP